MFHVFEFCLKLSSTSCRFGIIICKLWKNGVTNEMKPGWDLGMLVVSLSQSMLTGRFSCFSRSPWWKNSTNRVKAHSLAHLNGLDYCEISQEWSEHSIRNCCVLKVSDSFLSTKSISMLLPSEIE